MEGLFDFLANYYIWFAGASIFFAFALIGLVYESKKKKKEESKVADAVAQPLTAEATNITPDTPTEGVVVDTPQPTEMVQEGAPSLEGLEAQTDNFTEKDINNVGESDTLVIDDTQMPSAEPSLVIEDPDATPSAEPSLVIEDPAANAAPVEDIPAAPEAPVENPTLGNPGEPPM
jgi:hypothetical protein